MDVSRFDKSEPNYDDSHKCEFPLFDLVAIFTFKSATSISFDLRKWFSEIHKDLGPRQWFRTVGRVTVHHPCEGHIKAQLHIQCPAEYHADERMHEFVRAVFTALAIPADETFEAEFATCAKDVVCFVNDRDRNGQSDRISAFLCRHS